MPNAPSLPGAFAGVDKHDPVQIDFKRVVRPAWLEKLMHLSNFTFIGHYLTHSWKSGFYSRDPLLDGRQLWKEAFPELLNQEWGLWFIYLAIQQPDGKMEKYDADEWAKLPKSPPNSKSVRIEAARQMGMEHARALKTKYLKPLLPDIQGSIVYVDFDKQWGPGQVLPEMIAYYNGIWSEMRIRGNEGIAVRPGLYARRYPADDLLGSSVENTDLFIYKVDQLDHEIVEGKPFIEREGRIYSPMEEHPLRGCSHPDYVLAKKPATTTPTLGRKLLEGGLLDRALQEADFLEGGLFDTSMLKKALPKPPVEPQLHRASMIIGRQWVIYEGVMPDKTSKMPLPQVPSNWDFNSAMVRDLRYPIAMPRIAVLDEIRLRTVFDMPLYNPKGVQRLPTTRLEQVHSCAPQQLPFSETSMDEMLEHEAPICLLAAAPESVVLKARQEQTDKALPGLSEELFTINKNMQPVVITASKGGATVGLLQWSKPTYIISGGPALRRNRAMTVTKGSNNESLETKLFYISADLNLIGHRRTGYKPWSGAEVMSGDISVHTFTNITAVSRQHARQSALETVDIFFIDEPGSLRVATCNTKDWPLAEVILINSEPNVRLLTGTSMASVSPNPDETLFFGIGLDCHLYMTCKEGSSNWTELTRVDGIGGGAPLKREEDRLFVHAKMDAYVGIDAKTKANTVYVACLTAMNIPCLYILTKSSRWIMQERRYYHNRMRENLSFNDPLFEGAAGLPPDYEPKILKKGVVEVTEQQKEIINSEVRVTNVVKKVERNTKEGYGFNPFGDIKLSMVGGFLTFWIAGVTMVGTKGRSGDRCEMLFIKCLIPEGQGECWKRVKHAREAKKASGQ